MHQLLQTKSTNIYESPVAIVTTLGYNRSDDAKNDYESPGAIVNIHGLSGKLPQSTSPMLTPNN